MSISEIADQWKEMGRWWDGETAREFFLVVTVSGPFLLSRECCKDEWYAKAVQ